MAIFLDSILHNQPPWQAKETHKLNAFYTGICPPRKRHLSGVLPNVANTQALYRHLAGKNCEHSDAILKFRQNTCTSIVHDYSKYMYM